MRRTNQILPIGALLRRYFSDLYDQTYTLREMQNLLFQSCPALQEANIRIVRYQHRKLVLAVDSQTRAARVRYLLADLADELRKTHAVFSGLKSIKLVISPPTT